MPWGKKHRDVPIGKVPNSYLQWMVGENVEMQEDLRIYIYDRLNIQDGQPAVGQSRTVRDADVKKCKSCQANIIWITFQGKSIPLDAAPVTGFVRVDDDGGVGHTWVNSVLHINHFATCPDADEHRKPRESTEPGNVTDKHPREDHAPVEPPDLPLLRSSAF